MSRARAGLRAADPGSVSSIAEAAAAARLAEILTVGFERCEAEGRELSERQKIDLLTAALIGFDGLGDEVERHVELHGMLTALAADWGASLHARPPGAPEATTASNGTRPTREPPANPRAA